VTHLKLRIIQHKVLRKIFAPKREEVTKDWRKLRNENFMICTSYQIPLGYGMEGVRRVV
jgi:hypothetical protein